MEWMREPLLYYLTAIDNIARDFYILKMEELEGCLQVVIRDKKDGSVLTVTIAPGIIVRKN